MNEKNEKKNTHKDDVKVSHNIFVYFIIGLIVVAFLFGSGSVVKGVFDFIAEFGKERVVNDDGTISIKEDAPVGENSKNPNAYVGKVINKKIQFGRDDDFNRTLQYVRSANQLNYIEKYQQVRMAFDRTVNKIIAMHNAKKMGITVSKKLLIEEIANKYNYKTPDGEIDYFAIEENKNKINSDYSENVKNDLLYQQFNHDYFSGLPTSSEEVIDDYLMSNLAVKIGYIKIEKDVDDYSKLQEYLKLNENNYKKYKYTTAVFSEDNKDYAEEFLEKIKNSDFIETAEKMKEEEKLINIVYGSNYLLASNSQNNTTEKLLSSKNSSGLIDEVIEDEKLGYLVITIDDIQYPNMSDEQTFNQVKNDYMMENADKINNLIQEKAENIFKQLQENNNYSQVAQANSVNFIDVVDPVKFMEDISQDDYFSQPDQATQDKNFIINLFNENTDAMIKTFNEEAVGRPVAPVGTDEGMVIIVVNDRIKENISSAEERIDELSDSFSSLKSRLLEIDFYNTEKIKYKVVDNFNYCITIQDFISNQ